MACAMLNIVDAMSRFLRTSLLLASIPAISLVLVLVSEVARAQTTTVAPSATATATATATAAPIVCSTAATSPTLTLPADQFVPERYSSSGADLGTATRPIGEIQTGISYADCLSDMVLQFRMIACGFIGGVTLEAWASTSSDCTQPTERGIQGGIASCWPLNVSVAGLVAGDTPENYNIRVQDIVGPQNLSPSPTTYTRQGSSACNTQGSFLPVPININFLPLDTNGNLAGQAVQFPMVADMVGPPAPAEVKIGDGDTLFVVNWVANVDSDTTGYDIVIDPAPGQTSAVAGTGETKFICPEAGTSSNSTAEAGADSSASDAESTGDAESVNDAASIGDAKSGAVDATTQTSGTLNDAGCHTITSAGGTETANGGSCHDTLLSGGTTVDSGEVVDGEITSPTSTEEFDEAGNVIDSGIVAATGTGGNWTPPAGHVVNPNSSTGATLSGESNDTYTITGLKDMTTYTIVVAAVDGYGNIGPPSVQQCDFPAPVNDFWTVYRQDGGQAGGYCALEAVGAPAGSTVAFAGGASLVLATVRRRRRKKR